jgi:hypothetical protein
MDEDVGAPRELNEIVGSRGVARDDDGPVARIKPIAEHGNDGWMVHDGGAVPSGAAASLAGVLAKLNDVAFRVESITHRDAVE